MELSELAGIGINTLVTIERGQGDPKLETLLAVLKILLGEGRLLRSMNCTMITEVLKKVWKHRWVFRSILKTVYFNFHYLPFSQAVKLPILLYRPKFLSLKGSIRIDCKNVSTGMIVLGGNAVSIYPDTGIKLELLGGVITFKGKCMIGNNSALSVGSSATLTFGDLFCASANLKLVCWHQITFKDRVRVGWNNTFMDTDFHTIVRLSDGSHTKGYGEIEIGRNNWFGLDCVTMKNTRTPDYCTIAGGTLLNKRYDVPEYSVIGTTNKVEVLKSGVYRKLGDDTVNYNG